MYDVLVYFITHGFYQETYNETRDKFDQTKKELTQMREEKRSCEEDIKDLETGLMQGEREVCTDAGTHNAFAQRTYVCV